ncbi:unnamed protein product [Caenorhabditis bovis]|uniref:Palmitoyltransferase n=1 Tax=Caenorhabditis bovis TaxID=2654633 RepID=A0A8S1EXV6_9PELO|nr:unnamed protein product [Caenorhabditis bovis]
MFDVLEKITYKIEDLFAKYKAIRWLPVLVVAGACGWGYYAYVYELSIVTVTNWPQRILYIVGFHVLLVLFVSSYFKTIFTPPSKPPPEFFFEGEALQDIEMSQDDDRKLQMVLQRYAQQRNLPIRMKGYDNSVRYCEKCKCIKPDRSHHCSMCGQCVLKFDHHCPWVNNCVNFSNYKFFLLFLGYGFAFCLWIFFTDLPYFIDFWRTEFSNQKVSSRFHLLFLVFVSGMFSLSLSALFFYHLWLTSKNRSTVESFRAPMIDGRFEKNAFNHGIRANYREVFGSRKGLWLLPIYSTPGSGVNFEIEWARMTSSSVPRLPRMNDDPPLDYVDIELERIDETVTTSVDETMTTNGGKHNRERFVENFEILLQQVFEKKFKFFCSLGDGVRFEKWTVNEALAHQGAINCRTGNSIGALSYKLLAQREDEEDDDEKKTNDSESATLYSDEEDDLNIRVV